MEIHKKDKWMYRWYWKVLGGLIFLYVLIGGLTTPLHTGIHDLDGPATASPGEYIELKITGYNSHYSKAKTLSAWLKLDDSHFTKAIRIQKIDESRMIASFLLPPALELASYTPLTLITYNELDGPAVLPDAVGLGAIKPESDTAAFTQWVAEPDSRLTPPEGVRFPYRNILHETIRNTFFHVALWMAMVVLLMAGLFHAFLYLKNKDMRHDRISSAFNTTAIVYGLLGLATGSMWAKFTWGTWWTTDVKLNMAAIAMLIYLAYFILRSSMTDFDKRARFSAAYSIFGFVALIPLIFVIPRMYDSLHPGNGGNPALGGEDLDNTLRMFFYPSVIALILLGSWLSTIFYRIKRLEEYVHTKHEM